MAKGKKNRGGRKRALSGIEAVMAPTKMQSEISRKQLAIALGVLAGANVAGSLLLEKHVLIPAGIALAVGLIKKNLYWTAAGSGLLLAGAMPLAKPAIATEASATGDEVSGFDFKDFTEKVKERAKNYLANYKEKLYLPASTDAAVSGLNGEGDKVNYFVNPYAKANGQLDMSALDRIQSEVNAGNQMQGDGNAQEFEMSDRNF
jgi:hypothetical protein